MKLAMIGLGRMGRNMAKRLIQNGHAVVGYDQMAGVAEAAAQEAGLTPIASLDQIPEVLEPPRACWVMVPAGDPVEQTIDTLMGLLSPGDTIIDGGNSNFHDSIRRAQKVEAKGLHFLDVGVSGGIWGLTEGYSMMIGGSREVVDAWKPIFEALAPAPDQGWGWVGPHGAGHYVKMVHNGIEYGLMEAYAEGFELLRAHKGFDLDLYQIAEIWRFGTVIRSWLLDLTAAALKDDPDLSGIRGWVSDSGEGRWTVIDAIDQSVPVPVIALSLFQRFSSRMDERFADKLLAAMRNQFGGHEVKREPPQGSGA